MIEGFEDRDLNNVKLPYHQLEEMDDLMSRAILVTDCGTCGLFLLSLVVGQLRRSLLVNCFPFANIMAAMGMGRLSQRNSK